ncbi:hypothetical protein CRG98_030682 [Punica granatum]|uniref:DUF7745 domain-containing protein n=1 Tax=Punica granatum TaxID=22663 RepID=A0A2I0IZQ1_PUNGR|nr:hypothetical protein CRG98_030682 [Punica granatum]
MDRSRPCLRLDIIITPSADITRLWNTFRPVDRAFLRLIIGDLPLLDDSPIDWTLLRTAISFWDTRRTIFNFQGTELVPTVEEYAVLLQRSMPTHDIVRDACHGFLLLIFGTMLFPYSSNLIDGALAQVILQVVGGQSYVEAVVAETIRSLDYVREIRQGRMRGSPHLLQIWLLAHIRPFGLSHPFPFYGRAHPSTVFMDHTLESRRSYDHWMSFSYRTSLDQSFREHTYLSRPSHQTTRWPTGIQDIPIEADRSPHRFRWVDTTASLPDRVLRVREVRCLWGTRIVQEFYFPEHPTNEERAFSAIVAYVMQFHPYGFAPVRRLRIPQMLQTPQADIPDAESSVQGAMHTELQVIRAEQDRLRCELVDIRAELTDHRELQSKLAQTRACIVSQDKEIAHLSATLDRARARARRISHP